MKVEEIRNIMNQVIENEFLNISEYEEYKFTSTDKEQIELSKESRKLYDSLSKNMNESEEKKLDDYQEAVWDECVGLFRFYFKEGVKAGATKLNFIKQIDGVRIDSVL